MKPLCEPAHRIYNRQAAARRWIEYHQEQYGSLPDTVYTKTEKALLVIVLTGETVDYLAENDPQALKQAQLALSNKSWQDFSLDVTDSLSSRT